MLRCNQILADIICIVRGDNVGRDVGERPMRFRTVVSGTLAALMLGSSAFAGPGVTPRPEMAGGLPGVFEGRPNAPVVKVQAGDPTVQNLEEQVRALNGRVEELNFQILQMQEQLRKMQDDNEFRFQELEGGKKSDAGTTEPRKQAEAAPQGTSDQTAAVRQPSGNDAAAGALPPPSQPGQAPVAGSPESTSKTFGTIVFDQSGNVVGGDVGDQATIPTDPNGAEQLPGADNTVVAALPKTDDPEELYRDSYEFILSGQYATAEAGFSDHIKRFPEDQKSADARYWLGEAQLGQRKYRDAAETFLAANKKFPKSKKAPEMMLKLGVSLVGLNQRDIACATFSEIGKRYPNVSGAMKERVQQEQSQASC